MLFVVQHLHGIRNVREDDPRARMAGSEATALAPMSNVTRVAVGRLMTRVRIRAAGLENPQVGKFVVIARVMKHAGPGLRFRSPDRSSTAYIGNVYVPPQTMRRNGQTAAAPVDRANRDTGSHLVTHACASFRRVVQVQVAVVQMKSGRLNSGSAADQLIQFHRFVPNGSPVRSRPG